MIHQIETAQLRSIRAASLTHPPLGSACCWRVSHTWLIPPHHWLGPLDSCSEQSFCVDIWRSICSSLGCFRRSNMGDTEQCILSQSPQLYSALQTYSSGWPGGVQNRVDRPKRRCSHLLFHTLDEDNGWSQQPLLGRHIILLPLLHEQSFSIVALQPGCDTPGKTPRETSKSPARPWAAPRDPQQISAQIQPQVLPSRRNSEFAPRGPAVLNLAPGPPWRIFRPCRTLSAAHEDLDRSGAQT